MGYIYILSKLSYNYNLGTPVWALTKPVIVFTVSIPRCSLELGRDCRLGRENTGMVVPPAPRAHDRVFAQSSFS